MSYRTDGTRHHSRNEETPTYQLRWQCIGRNRNISGYALSGELFAFLGIDDANKTNLLKTVARYANNLDNHYIGGIDQTQSLVALNGDQIDEIPENFSFVEVPHCSNLYGCLSVLETLTFSAELRFESFAMPAEMAALRLMNEMGIEELAEKRIDKLTTWQRRVVLFATEVIAGKDVLFFDQPTADLDASSALSLVTALQRVARSGRLVAMTSGSLTFREYAILDRIQLLSRNG
jgi:ABC-type multidrug transport system ATPase subunit